MGWNAGVDRSAGDIISATDWNNYNGASGSLEYLKAKADAPVVGSKNSGADEAAAASVNFIEGSGVTLTVARNGGTGKLDVTIAASGSVVPTQGTDNSGWVAVANPLVTPGWGAYQELLASTAYNAVGIIVGVQSSNGAATLLTIATGAAASETAKIVLPIPYLQIGISPELESAANWTIPFSIASGTRISAKIYATAASGGNAVSITMLG